MSFLCRVRWNPQIAALLEPGPVQYRDRVAECDVFHTVLDELFLRELAARARNQSPLLHFWLDEVVHWVGRGATRPHVRRTGGAQAGDPASGALFAHDWARIQLYRLGQRMRQRPHMEHTLIDGRRCDVTWQSARIAWEIDLTAQAQLDQDLRAAKVRAAGYRMISLIDAKDRNRTNVEVPRLRFARLKDPLCDEDYVRAQRFWPTTFVRGVVDLSETDPPVWIPRDGFRFRDFCDALLRKELVYSDLGTRSIVQTTKRARKLRYAPRKPAVTRQFGWVRPEHYKLHMNVSYQHERRSSEGVDTEVLGRNTGTPVALPNGDDSRHVHEPESQSASAPVAPANASRSSKRLEADDIPIHVTTGPPRTARAGPVLLPLAARRKGPIAVLNRFLAVLRVTLVRFFVG